MKKTLSLIAIFIIVFSMFSPLVPQAMGWSSVPPLDLHADMALDALEGLGWSEEEIGDIPEWANHPDYFWAPDYEEYYDWFNHRVYSYQQEFLFWESVRLGYNVTMERPYGAEDAVAYHITLAKEAYEKGDIAEGQRQLGYAIHFIQDAVCPPHVFPFSENKSDGADWVPYLWRAPHTHFEYYTVTRYPLRYCEWRLPVRQASALQIMSPTHLYNKVLWAADLVRSRLKCDYVRADGQRVGDPPDVGWNMSDDDIAFCMGIAASLVKGAAIWTTEGEWAADVMATIHGPMSVMQGSHLTLTVNYFNMEQGKADDVVLTVDFSPSMVSFVSVSDGGVFDETFRLVMWDLDSLAGGSSGSVSLTVAVAESFPTGLLLESIVEISTTSPEYDTLNNRDELSTRVVQCTNMEVVGSGFITIQDGTFILRVGQPTTFIYHGDANVVGITIKIHKDTTIYIQEPMERILGTYNWVFTYIFRIMGSGQVTLIVYYANGDIQTESYNINVIGYDPSGYVYNSLTRQPIQGATVTLQRFDIESKQFVSVPPDDLSIDPNINPQTTDEIGGYGWDVSAGIYKVRAGKQGYTSNFALVSVPPPATDVNIPLMPIDMTPPVTSISFEEPSYVDLLNNTHLTSATLVELMAEDDPGGSGVASTVYKIHNATYDSGWITCTEPFYLIGLSDSAYQIDYNSTDNAGNVEPTNTVTVILDNTPPTTTLSIGEPKYTSDTIYVTPDTQFTLEATDSGSGIYSTAYRIRNATYDSGWLTYSAPFHLTSLADGIYTIAYNSTDNVGNVETTHATSVTLFSWNYIFTDSYGRGTTLKINIAHKFFQFITPDKDYGIRKATYMHVYNRAIIICHKDNELKLATVSVDTKLDFCIAYAKDIQTGKEYWLIDKVGTEN